MPGPRRGWTTRLLAVALLVLSPICGEYLSGYDESTGHPAALLSGLIFFVPLYGCAALLIREVARRAGLGWIGILLLAATFGLVQAGLVDQSLFSPDYRGLDGWEEMVAGTLIAPLGLSASNLIGFVGGHVMLSIAGPIALVEGWAPRRSQQSWIGIPGLVLCALGYVVASLLVLQWHLETESWHAATGQLVGAGLVAVALVVLSVVLGRRRWRSHPVRPGGPGLLLTAGVAVVLATVHQCVPLSWLGVAISVVVLVTAAILLVRSSRTERWAPVHVALVGAAPLVVTGVIAFTYDPLIGEVSAGAKYGHNVVMLLIVLGAALVAVLAGRRASTAEASTDDPGVRVPL